MNLGKSFLLGCFVLSAGAVQAAEKAVPSTEKRPTREDFEDCIKKTGINPQPGQPPSEQDREAMHKCLSEKGFKGGPPRAHGMKKGMKKMGAKPTAEPAAE